MQIKTVTPPILNAVVSMLQPFAPELSPSALMDAIRTFNPETSARPSCAIEKPMTRQQTAELLGVSLPTINRLLNRGTLRRIYITPGAVKVDHASVRALLSGNATEAVSGTTTDEEA